MTVPPKASDEGLAEEAEAQRQRAARAQAGAPLPSDGRLQFLREMDASHLYDVLEGAVLSTQRRLTRVEVAEQAGVPLDRAIRLWRALGFPGTQDDEAVFVEADVVALRLVTWLVDEGWVDPDAEVGLVRSMGRTFARLAEWEVAELAGSMAAASNLPEDQEQLEELVVSLVPVIEDIQNYVWRRHVANAAGRVLLRPLEGQSTETAVGFADIVGYTRASRNLSPDELARMVDTFEDVATSVVTENGGRVIKTIGDEILFVVDDPRVMARTALELTEVANPEFPELHVGAAYGQVLTRLGDVFGPVVNIAARLTALSRPNRVLIDRRLSEELEGDPEFRVKRSRSKAVRGYRHLEVYGLKRPRDRGVSGPRLHFPALGVHASADLFGLGRVGTPGRRG